MRFTITKHDFEGGPIEDVDGSAVDEDDKDDEDELVVGSADPL